MYFHLRWDRLPLPWTQLLTFRCLHCFVAGLDSIFHGCGDWTYQQLTNWLLSDWSSRLSVPGVAYFFKLFTTRAVCSACTAYTSCDSIQWTLRLCQWTSTTKLKCFKVRQLGFRGEGKSRDSTPMNCWRLSLSSPDSTGTVAYPEFQTLSRWGTILSPRHPRVPLRPLGTGRRPTTVVHHQAECQPVSSTRTPSLCLTLPDAIPCGESVVNFATTQVGQGQRLWGRRGLVAGGVAFCLTLLQCLAAEPDSYRFVLGLNSQRFFFFFFFPRFLLLSL